MLSYSFPCIQGTIAFKMKDIDQSLGTYRNETTDIHAESVFTDMINKGFLTYPTQKLLDNVKKMYEIFCHYNPNYTIKNGPSIVSNLRQLLEHKMKNENLHPKILDFASHFLIYVRLGTINKLVKTKKDGSEKHAQTLRGGKKTLQLSQA